MDGTILLAMAQIHPQQQVFTALENQLLMPAEHTRKLPAR